MPRFSYKSALSPRTAAGRGTNAHPSDSQTEALMHTPLLISHRSVLALTVLELGINQPENQPSQTSKQAKHASKQFVWEVEQLVEVVSGRRCPERKQALEAVRSP